jgi:hypothetical protein
MKRRGLLTVVIWAVVAVVAILVIVAVLFVVFRHYSM